MFETILYAFLLSISPFGEARAGIPYAILNNVHFILAFVVGTVGNALIYPLFMWLVDTFSKRFWPFRLYKRGVIFLSRRAKKLAGKDLQKHGFWGLMIFVMVPLPGTGAYMGAIAATLFKIERRRAFLAISIGVVVSSLFVALATHFGQIGFMQLTLK